MSPKMAWSAALSCVVVLAGCGGADPGVLGGTGGDGTTNTHQPDGSAGSATQASGGQGSSPGSGGQAGQASGGAVNSAGASNSAAGSGGAPPPSGGGSTSIPEECFRPYICVDKCGGDQQNFGCRECPSELIDTIYCPEADATTGLFGTVNFLEGDHQPTTGQSTGATTPVARELRVYGPVAAGSADRDPAKPLTPGLYSTIRAPLQAKAHSGQDGKYTVTLRPGKYSVFVKDGDDWYCNRKSDDGLCVVEVPASATLKYDIDITYAAVF